jgi:hypothetical protein
MRVSHNVIHPHDTSVTCTIIILVFIVQQQLKMNNAPKHIQQTSLLELLLTTLYAS